ncbi:MAG TPA: DNA-directed RNA polymerase subunit omega [Atribacteraceae bacterium]|nr:DNA-directed RNA polymerase subunit omega [Atribacteraceae bacterium]
MLPIDELVRKTGNRYILTSVVAKRAKQLNEGANPIVMVEGYHKPLIIALLEIEKKTGEIELTTKE